MNWVHYVKHPTFSRRQLNGKQLVWYVPDVKFGDGTLRATDVRTEDDRFVLWWTFLGMRPPNSQGESEPDFIEQSVDQAPVSKIEAIGADPPLHLKGFDFAI